jgi:DNA-binding transcriptional regulator YdaS (Cro superfamily)
MKLKTYLKSEALTLKQFADKVGCTPGAVWQWATDYQKITAENALLVEKATDGKVTRHELRPDLWPRDSAA